MSASETENETKGRKKLAQLSKALGHPYRIKIIQILADLPDDNRCMVNSIVDQLPISQSTVSQHLKILKEAGWIKGKVEGPRTCYCLKKGILDSYKELINWIAIKN